MLSNQSLISIFTLLEVFSQLAACQPPLHWSHLKSTHVLVDAAKASETSHGESGLKSVQ